MPQVDVLMPVAAVAVRLLERAVGSILRQTACDLRLLAIDDGASCEARAWLEQQAARDARLVVIATGAAGIVGALSAGLSSSDAPLVARMDADDVAMPWRLEQQCEAMRRCPALDLVATPVLLEGAAGPGWVRHVAWTNRLMTATDHAAERFVDAPVVHPTVMMRRSRLEQWGGYREGPFAEDYELWLRAMAHGASFAKTPWPGLVWNRGPATLTAQNPRYAGSAMMRLRSQWLAVELRSRGGRFVVWGAGESGRRLIRELERERLASEAIYDIDPRKIGRAVRGIRVRDARELGRVRPWEAGVPVISAVASPGARYLIADRLAACGARILRDWLPAA